MNQPAPNYSPQELAKFAHMAPRWWDPEGECKPLHDINPLRLEFIEEKMPLAGKRVVDVGCGGGILSEAMAQRGAQVVGIDASEATLGVAKLHLQESGLTVDYRCTTAEALAAEEAGGFDAVTCMEMLEHVPDPQAVITACANLVKPGGHVFLSTINRNPKAYLLAIVGAEYVLGMLPRGTHDFSQFIRPAELDRWLRSSGLDLQQLRGITYNPLTRRYRLSSDVDVNYLAWATP